MTRKESKSMDPQTACFVSGVLAPTLRLSRFAGLAPLQFEKKRSGWHISVSRGWSVYGYFLATIIILITTGTLITELQIDQDKSVRMRSDTRRVVWIVDASIMMLIAGTAVYRAPKQMRSIIACVNQVQRINFELSIPLWPTNTDKKKIGLLYFWVTATVFLTIVDHVLLTMSIVLLHAETWISIMYSLYYCCYWILQLCEMQFVFITLHVKYSLKGVNDGLKNLVHEFSDFKKVKTPKRKSLQIPKKYFNSYVSYITVSEKTDADYITKPTNLHHENVHKLALAYASVCDVVREVDECFGLVVLMMLGSFLLHLVCTPYYLFNNLTADSTSPTSTAHSINVVVQLSWCIYHMVNLVMIIEPCHLTHMEMETTRVLVSHLMRFTHSVYDPLAVELELFFKHLVLNQSTYSPLQVTTMSRCLVATILGSITTYLVVIIQL